MVIAVGDVPKRRVEWHGAVRIIRSLFPPIDLFEDIADPQDWPLLISAEQKTNPRLMETIGNLDLIPAERRVGGPGSTYLMAPFTHVSPDRPSRFRMVPLASSMPDRHLKSHCSRRCTTVRASWRGRASPQAGCRNTARS